MPDKVKALLEKFGKTIEFYTCEASEEDVKWWTKVAGGAGVMAKKNGKFVLVKGTLQSWGKSSAYWSFPGSAVKHGEDFEVAAIREFEEETGLNVEITGLLFVHGAVFEPSKGKQLVFFSALFEGNVVGGEMKPADSMEISEIGLFSELPEDKLVPWLRDELTRAGITRISKAKPTSPRIKIQGFKPSFKPIPPHHLYMKPRGFIPEMIFNILAF